MSVLPKSMLIEPVIQVNNITLEKAGFCDYAYDFENNALLTKDGKHYYVYGNEAMKIWIYKAMLTARYKYSAYSDNFGTEIYELVGEVISNKLKQEEIKRYLIETLMVHPFITSITKILLKSKRDGIEVEVYYRTVFNDEVVSISCIVPIN